MGTKYPLVFSHGVLWMSLFMSAVLLEFTCISAEPWKAGPATGGSSGRSLQETPITSQIYRFRRTAFSHRALVVRTNPVAGPAFNPITGGPTIGSGPNTCCIVDPRCCQLNNGGGYNSNNSGGGPVMTVPVPGHGAG